MKTLTALPHPALMVGSLAVVAGLLIARPPFWIGFPAAMALIAACEHSRQKRAKTARRRLRTESCRIT